MPVYKDEEGNEVETLSPEEADELKKSKEDLDIQLKEQQEKLENNLVKLQKLEKKDFDYKSLDFKAKSKEEEAKQTQEQIKSIQQKLADSWKKSAIKDIFSKELNEEQKKEFDSYFNQLMVGKDANEEEIAKAVKSSYKIVLPENEKINTLNMSSQTGEGKSPTGIRKENFNNPNEGLSEEALWWANK